MPEPTGGALNAEGNDFAQFVESREQALRRTAWLLTGDWVSTATNKAGNPITTGHLPDIVLNGQIAITPDGKTAYVACEGAVVPVSTATNTPGKPIPIPFRDPQTIAITP